MKSDPFNHDGVPPEAGHSEPLDGAIPDELVDRFLDREISAQDRARLAGALDADSGVCERLARLSFAFTKMKKGVKAPDLSDEILDRVDRLRGFVAPSRRPLIRLGRLAVAASMFGIIAGAVIVRRSAPDLVEMGEPLPLRDMARAAERDAAGMSAFASTISTTGLSRAVVSTPQDARDGRVGRVGWHDDADSAQHVTWSWSPVAACDGTPDEDSSRVLVVVGGRVVSIERASAVWRQGTGEIEVASWRGGEAGLFSAAGAIAPASLTPKPAGRCVRDARLSDLP